MSYRLQREREREVWLGERRGLGEGEVWPGRGRGVAWERRVAWENEGERRGLGE